MRMIPQLVNEVVNPPHSASRWHPFYGSAFASPKWPCQQEFYDMMRCLTEGPSKDCLTLYEDFKGCLKEHGLDTK